MLTQGNDSEFNNPLIFDDDFYIHMQHALWFIQPILWSAYNTYIYVNGIECNYKNFCSILNPRQTYFTYGSEEPVCMIIQA